MEPSIDPAPWRTPLLKDQHLAEIQEIREDFEESLVRFSLSVQRSIKLVDDAALQQLYEIDRKATEDKEQMYHRQSSLSLLQMQDALGDIDRSCHKQKTELSAEKEAYKLVLQNMGRALIDSIGRLLIEARLDRLESVKEARAAFTEEALRTGALGSRPAPAVETARDSRELKSSKPLKPILKHPDGSRKPEGLDDRKYS